MRRRKTRLVWDGQAHIGQVEAAERLGISRQRVGQLLDQYGQNLAFRFAPGYSPIRKAAPPSPKKPRATVYRCGRCGELGHNRRTCVQAEAAE